MRCKAIRRELLSERVSTWSAIAAPVLAGAAALGCGDSGPLHCTPEVGGVLPEKECGIYVSASRGDDGNAGDSEHPVKTLENAITLAAKGGNNVYACGESYRERGLTLYGVNLWGGFECASGFRYTGGETRARISIGSMANAISAADAILANIRLEAASQDEPSRSAIGISAGRSLKLFGSEILVGDGAAPGGGSIGVVMGLESDLEIADCRIVTGDGADGDPVGPPHDMDNRDPDSGIWGFPPCYERDNAMFDRARRECTNATTLGGIGGLGWEDHGDDGEPGLPLPVPNPTGAGLGGRGERDGAPCTAGQPGLPGASGLGGFGAGRPGGHGFYRFNIWGQSLDDGHEGERGRPGQGGGGGGGSRLRDVVCEDGPAVGSSGGWGGAGGCGGLGGRGGRSGGSSVGVLFHTSKVTIRNTSFKTGQGGRGGTGSAGLLGEEGGEGGRGGSPLNAPEPAGCPGGNGGRGGPGGPGGGGLGGNSVMVMGWGPEPADDPTNTFEPGAAGQGGLGGDPSVLDSAGEDGTQGRFAAIEHMDREEWREIFYQFYLIPR
jgi:hypothetical protein